MRRLLLAFLTIVAASVASAQVLVVGAAGGATWELYAEADDEQTFLRGDDLASAAFVAFFIDDFRLLRLQVRTLPRTAMVDGTPWDSRVRAYTVGVDYFFQGVFGEGAFSGGIGAYEQDMAGEHEPAGVATTEFGWYVGIGEWFHLSRRTDITVELTMDRTGHDDSPVLFTGTVGLAFRF